MARLHFSLRSGNVEIPRYVRTPDNVDYTPHERAALVVMAVARLNGCNAWHGPVEAGRSDGRQIWRATLGTSSSDGMTPRHEIEVTLKETIQ